MAVQGVFIEQADGTLHFVPTPAPTDLEVARLLAAVRRRIVRLVVRHGIDLEEASRENEPEDERLARAPARTPPWLSTALPLFDGATEPAGLWPH